jgi:DUF2892 family protein
MKANIGNADRVIRLIVGLALISMLFVLHGPARWFGLVGLIPLLTGLIRYCPLYSILGLNSCPFSRQNDEVSGGTASHPIIPTPAFEQGL